MVKTTTDNNYFVKVNLTYSKSIESIVAQLKITKISNNNH